VAPLIRATVILIYSMLVMQVSYLLFSSLEIQNVDVTRENTLIFCYLSSSSLLFKIFEWFRNHLTNLILLINSHIFVEEMPPKCFQFF